MQQRRGDDGVVESLFAQQFSDGDGVIEFRLASGLAWAAHAMRKAVSVRADPRTKSGNSSSAAVTPERLGEGFRADVAVL